MNFEKKYELVLEAYNNAYAKYSNFQVGAVVITSAILLSWNLANNLASHICGIKVVTAIVIHLNSL